MEIYKEKLCLNKIKCFSPTVAKGKCLTLDNLQKRHLSYAIDDLFAEEDKEDVNQLFLPNSTVGFFLDKFIGHLLVYAKYMVDFFLSILVAVCWVNSREMVEFSKTKDNLVNLTLKYILHSFLCNLVTVNVLRAGCHC